MTLVMLKRSILLVCITFFLFGNIYLALAQTVSLECLVRKYDGPGGRRAGDIISVKQLPHKGWGRKEGPPNYVIIKITGVSLDGFKQYKGRHVLLDDKDLNGEIVRSKYRYDLTTLPSYSELSSKIEVNLLQTVSNLIDRRKEILSSR